MSLFTKPNYVQPVDFIKEEHIQLVHKLRRKELKLANFRRLSVKHILCIEENGSDYSSSEMSDHTSDKGMLEAIDNELINFMHLLENYYKYSQEYCDILHNNKLEQLPIDWMKCAHDGLWGRDPTIHPIIPEIYISS